MNILDQNELSYGYSLYTTGQLNEWPSDAFLDLYFKYMYAVNHN